MIDVTLQLFCTRKAGSLSQIIRAIKLFGLQYQNHKIGNGKKYSVIMIIARGNLNCTRQALQEYFLNLPEVIKVQKLEITRNGKNVSEFKTTRSDAHITATEKLTPAIILAAEKRLAEVLGPVASFIVETQAEKCRYAGEFYQLLAFELKDEKERKLFLSVIDGVAK